MTQFYDEPVFAGVAVKNILLLGFSGSLDALVRDTAFDGEDGLEWETISHPLRAQRRLEQLLDAPGLDNALPYAIVCNWQWLNQYGEGFAMWLNEQPRLRDLPFIALAEKPTVISVDEITKMGLDDCYTFPISWSILEKRVAFLAAYKPSLRKKAAQLEAEQYKMRMPLGKRMLDILGALIGILVTLPIWLPTMIAIRLESKGPVIYRSKRVGAGYQVFHFLKFRSMYKDADQRLKDLAHMNQYQNGSAFIKIANDPRITRVGRIIRKYSIDELPQLINILRGDMSLVGNRPLPMYEAEQLTNDTYSARFLAPAGLTGLWQVTKRGSDNMSMDERIGLDIAYRDNLTIRTDLHIMMRTFTSFIQKENV